MRTAIDSNILSALWSGETPAVAITKHLSRARERGALLIAPIAYVEILAYPRASEQFVLGFLKESGITIDFDLHPETWATAGRQYSSYAARRRRSGGGESRRLAADFIVGAHAMLQADQLFTMDIARYKIDFPELRLLRVDEQP